jgi:hypothetical protein
MTRVRAAWAAALMLGVGPAAAQDRSSMIWELYSYPDSGFAIQFPAQPAIMAADYRTIAGLRAPATTYSAPAGSAVFTLTVADFAGTALNADAAIKDAVAAVGRRGEVKIDVEARINHEYGRELSVVGKSGDRSVVAVFFIGQKLYLLDGHAFGPNALAATASLIRFQQSLQFTGS